MRGLHDEIRCEYPLPNPLAQDKVFVSKASMDLSMEEYTIKSDGTLIRHDKKREWQKDDNEPLRGSFRTVAQADRVVEHHGDIYMWTQIDGKHLEYRVRFTHGKVESIEEGSEEESPINKRTDWDGEGDMRGSIRPTLG
jgi:hypothetical protein